MFKKFSAGQMVYVDMYDSVGKVVVVSDDGDDIWYGVKCLDGKFGMHNCDGYKDDVIERVDYCIVGSECEWFLEGDLSEFDMPSFLEKRGQERIDMLSYIYSKLYQKSIEESKEFIINTPTCKALSIGNEYVLYEDPVSNFWDVLIEVGKKYSNINCAIDNISMKRISEVYDEYVAEHSGD